MKLAYRVFCNKGFPGDAAVEKPPADAGDAVRSLGQEDPLEKEMATHSSMLAWEMPWTEEPGGLQSVGPRKSWTELTRAQYLQRLTRIKGYEVGNISHFSAFLSLNSPS